MGDFLQLKKSNCKNCYKCIRHCGVKAIRFSGGQANIVGNECVLCGQCFVVCPQNAKEIKGDRERVRVLLEDYDTVIASVDPSFIANWDQLGIHGMRKALKQLGFTDVEEAAIGATIVKNEYAKILKEKKPDILISSNCHSVNLLIQKHYPYAIPYLANVVSSMQAHCIDIKKRFPEAKTVFIGPCIARKGEASDYKGIVDAVLTFEDVRQMLEEEGIVLEPEMDNTVKSKARIVPIAGGFARAMNEKEPGYDYITIDGIENCISVLKEIQEGKIHNCFIEMSACYGSCSNGPVMEKYNQSLIRSHQSVVSYAGEEDFEVDDLTAAEKKKIFQYIEQTAQMPTEAQIRECMIKMGKTQASQELNCGSCGYRTCRDKAIAIFQGKAETSMCMSFIREKAENFSGNIINNTPNGIMVLNENLEVQQINKSACEILNLPSAASIMGEQVVRIMETKDFEEVLKTGHAIRDKRIYLTEYRKYVEFTIVYDKEYRTILCIMKDVTQEEEQRIRKEELSRETIDVADRVVEKQMRIVQEIASLLGETAAETKIALTKLKESVQDE